MELEKCTELLLTRRSVRRFLDREVEDDKILKALDIARYAPSAKNKQPWEFIVIKDPETMKKLSKLRPGAAPLANAKAAIAIVADAKTSPHTYAIDCACVTTYLLLALHALGLGAVWINLFEHEEAENMLRIPREEGKRLFAVVAIGYPAETPQPPPRRSLEDILYFERYGQKKR